MNQPKSAKGTWTLTHALSDRALIWFLTIWT
jgi:hypothetical protein